MPEARMTFDDPDAYERYMGPWSRAVGKKFLDWIAAPTQARWLDVGCGSGAFTELIFESSTPAMVFGIDPSPEQIAHASKRLAGRAVDVRLGSAGDLPFGADEFDLVVSSLSIHFVPDRLAAFREMLRVAKPGGLVGGYTWRRSPTIVDAPYGPLARAIAAVGGELTMSPTIPEAMPEGLRSALVSEGYADLEITTIEASHTFRDFEDYWFCQTATLQHPVARSAAALSDEDRERVRGNLRAELGAAADGSVTYPSRATAFKARKPR